MQELTSSHSAPWNTTRLSHSLHFDGARSFLSLCVCAALDICVLRKGPGELAASVIISLRPKKQCLEFYFCSVHLDISKGLWKMFPAIILADCQHAWTTFCAFCSLYNMYAMSNSQREHVWKSMYKTSPLSEGDGGSLSSRSSAEDMVPVDGVLGSLLLKSPGKWQKVIICFNT